MDYYEELGLTPQASIDEIRQSYRNLSRILHPDQQTDDNLRRLADSQMKRLNTIHDVLTDAVKRRQYDLSLSPNSAEERRPVIVAAAPAGGQAIELPPWANSNRLVWLLIVSLGAGTVLWSLRNPRPPNPLPVETFSPQSKAALTEARSGNRESQRKRIPADEEMNRAKQSRDSPRCLQAVQPERGTTLPNSDQLKIPQPSIPAAFSTLAGIQPPEPIKPVAPVDVLNADNTCPYVGTWFWARPKALPPSDALYPPDYIEMVVTEEGGLLEGRYRARYRIADRAISPHVLFQFTGKPAGESAVLKWTGAGGAKGEVCLRLLAGDSMEVKWTALELGSQLDLASGSAVLIRWRDP